MKRKRIKLCWSALACLFLALLTPCHAVQAQHVTCGGAYVVSDDCPHGGPGDRDGDADPNETVRFYLSCWNETLDLIPSFTCRIMPYYGWTLTKDTAMFPAMGGFDRSTNVDDPYELIVAGPECDRAIEFELECDSTYHIAPHEAGFWTGESFCEPCIDWVPALEVAHVEVRSDTCLTGAGHNNLLPEPGERIELAVNVRNVDSVPAVDIEATLTSDNVDVTTLVGTISRVGPNQTRWVWFTFAIPEDAPCGQDLDFDLELSHFNGTVSKAFSLHIPSPCKTCLDQHCTRGVPERITDLALMKGGAADDVDVTFTKDTRAEGGFNLYVTEAKEDVPSMRLDLGATPEATMAYHDPLPFTVAASGPMAYLQLVGVCQDRSAEGPN